MKNSNDNQVKPRKLYKPRRNSPNGFRITLEGTYEVTDLSVVTYGLHNNTCDKTLVQAGYRFNYIGSMGEWYDVLPVFKREDNTYYTLIGEPADHVDRYNKANQTVIMELLCGRLKYDHS